MQRWQETRRGYLNNGLQKENRGKTEKVNGGENKGHIRENNNNRRKVKNWLSVIWGWEKRPKSYNKRVRINRDPWCRRNRNHGSLKVATINNPTLPVEKFLNILYANYHVRCFHRCELTDSAAAIQKDKKECAFMCVHACVCWEVIAQQQTCNFSFVMIIE